MKLTVRKLFRSAGFDIIRYQKHIEIPSKEQLRTVKSERLTLHETKTGNYYLPTDAHQDIVANTIINNQIFEEEVVACAKKYIKPGTVVLDVGANFGQMSILFSELVGRDGIVYSFDADDFIFDVLKKNIEANNCNNIIPVFGAVHDVANDILYFPEQDFERFGAYGSYGIDYVNKKGREVSTLTIDSLSIERDISFIKVDIQGGDLHALKGARETIKKFKMPILFEFEYQFQDELNLNFQEYVDFVQEIGYKFQRIIYGHNFLIVPKE